MTMTPAEIRILRQAAGLTQKALAERMGLSAKRGKFTVSEWESARNLPISEPHARLLALVCAPKKKEKH